jgi:hypothetical protein
MSAASHDLAKIIPPFLKRASGGTPPRLRAPRPSRIIMPKVANHRRRRKTPVQIKALKMLGWPKRRIAALSEEAATTIIAKGGRYELRTHERLLARGSPSAKPRPERPRQGLEINPQKRGDDDMKTFSHKSNARRAARAELGAKATEGVDYRLVSHGGGIGPQAWAWKIIGPLPRKARGSGAKESTLKALLARKGGATVGEICEDTGWLPHSARARICGLRKAGATIKTIRASGKEAKYQFIGAT